LSRENLQEEKTRCVAKLQPDEACKRFTILLESGVSTQDMEAAEKATTVKKGSLVCAHCHQTTPMSMLRGDRRAASGTAYGLRLWENDDLVPRPDDVFQERLYCIRWVETVTKPDGTTATFRHYYAPDTHDLQREAKVLKLLRERFHTWQAKGYLPSRRIEPGDETTRLLRERGWTHWHHLFHPRQLLVQGLFAQQLSGYSDTLSASSYLLGLGRCLDTGGSKLCAWNSSVREIVNPTFLNQALNTLVNYGMRTTISHRTWFLDIISEAIHGKALITSEDARHVSTLCDVWITDPPYADAVNYHELSEFFLAWYEKHLQRVFPDWYTDSKRALAITGSDENFRKSMVDQQSA